MDLRGTLLATILAAGALVGCGTATSSPNLLASTALTATTNSDYMDNAVYGSVPPPSAFQTIECVVTKILPEDTQGLPHQRFIVQDNDSAMTLEVDNDETYGEKVPGLQVGEQLEIRGVEYHDISPRKDGIHWTHHARRPGDAGYIQTPDGNIYQ